MNKFMLLYRADVSAVEQMANSTPEQAEAGMAEWTTWARTAGSALVDLGSPLGCKVHLGSDSGAPSDVCGFSVLEADSVESAQAILEGHPHTKWGGTIDVLEFVTLPGM